MLTLETAIDSNVHMPTYLSKSKIKVKINYIAREGPPKAAMVPSRFPFLNGDTLPRKNVRLQNKLYVPMWSNGPG